MTWNGIERRRFTRASLSCRLNIGAGKEIMMVKTENIGVGGIRVILKKDIPKGTELKLELFLNDGTVIHCGAYIVWTMQRTNPRNINEVLYDTGMQFESISDKDKERISELVKEFTFAQERSR